MVFVNERIRYLFKILVIILFFASTNISKHVSNLLKKTCIKWCLSMCFSCQKRKWCQLGCWDSIIMCFVVIGSKRELHNGNFIQFQCSSLYVLHMIFTFHTTKKMFKNYHRQFFRKKTIVISSVVFIRFFKLNFTNTN